MRVRVLVVAAAVVGRGLGLVAVLGRRLLVAVLRRRLLHVAAVAGVIATDGSVAVPLGRGGHRAARRAVRVDVAGDRRRHRDRRQREDGHEREALLHLVTSLRGIVTRYPAA